MPVYEYKCHNCKYIFEKLITNNKQKNMQICPKCSSVSYKILSAIGGFQFKGKGFYETEYKKKKEKE